MRGSSSELLAGSSDPIAPYDSNVELDAHGIFRTSVAHEATAPAHDSGCNGLRAACIVPELPWGMPAEARRVLPGRVFSRVWEAIVALSSLYVGFAVPIVVGMSKVYFPDGTCAVNLGRTLRPWEAVFAIAEAGNDLIFVADIIITFYTAIWEISTFGVPHWVLIDDLPTIRTIYLRGTFCWDVLASIPYQYVDCFFLKTGFVRVLRLLKLIRLGRVRRMIAVLQYRLPKLVAFLTFFELLLMLLLVAHWCVCV